PLDGEVPLVRALMHGALEPLRLVLKGDRVARLEGADDVRVVHPAIAAIDVVALEGAEDHLLAGDHEAPPRRLARLGEIALCAVGHPGGIKCSGGAEVQSAM